MISVKKILVPTDFSKHAAAALDTAIELARSYGAQLAIIYVYQPPTYVLPDGYIIPTASQMEMLFAETERHLAEAKRAAEAAGVGSVATKLLQGVAVTEIVRFARESGADLIVMGTHGRTGFKHLMLGSVAENVVRRAECSVLTTRAHE